jgi:hypothetical protein
MNRLAHLQPAFHDWIPFRLGRRCAICGLTQLRGEFDDAAPCKGSS